MTSLPGVSPPTAPKRFAWRGNVPTERTRADYEVSGTDWLTLVVRFGLSPYLHNKAAS